MNDNNFKLFIRSAVKSAPEQKTFPRYVMWIILLVAIGLAIGNLFN